MGLEKKKILILDDDSNMRMLLDFVLHKQYDIYTKENGARGMDWLARGNHPDLIIADIDMPEMDGLAFLKKIQQNGYLSTIPVIILSGHQSNKIRLQSFREGAADYQTKPFVPDEIYYKIEKALQAADVSSHAD